MINEVNPPLDELEHHGVKGMKWGVRRRAQIERVAAGKGSRLDRAKVSAFEVSRSSVQKHGSLSKAAGNKARNMKVRDARIAAGKASIKDVLARNGGDRLFDTGNKA